MQALEQVDCEQANVQCNTIHSLNHVLLKSRAKKFSFFVQLKNPVITLYCHHFLNTDAC